MLKLRINLKIMLLSFVIGLALVYIMSPAPVIRLRFPTPFNSGKVVYKDAGDTCYKYKAKQVTCDEKRSKPQPIVED